MSSQTTRDKIVGKIYFIYEIVGEVIITKARQGRAQAAEAKEIDNRGMGEYHGPYFFSRLRSVKAHEEPGLLAGC